MQQIQLGSMTVDALSDGELRMPLLRLLGEQDVNWLRSFGGCDEDGVASCPLTTYVIRTGTQTVVVDTGCGPDIGSLGVLGTSDMVGGLPRSMADAELDPLSVDMVVFTHMHRDHIGWTVTNQHGEAQLMFPNAHHIVMREEWLHWRGLNNDEFEQCMGPAERLGALRLVDDGYEPAPGVRLLSTPGHTPGHASILLYGSDAGAVITGDAAHHPCEIEDPTLRALFDFDPDQSSRSRIALVERIEAEGLLVLGGHFPAPGAGRLSRVEGRRTFSYLES